MTETQSYSYRRNKTEDDQLNRLFPLKRNYYQGWMEPGGR